MIRISLVLLCLGVSSAHAAECPADLMERWKPASGLLLEWHTEFNRRSNLRVEISKERRCDMATRMPAVMRVAREFYSVCDPMAASRELPGLEQFAAQLARYRTRECMTRAQDPGEPKRALSVSSSIPGHEPYNRGVALGRAGDLKGAIASFDKAIAMNPKEGLFYRNRGLAKSLAGDYEAGIEDFNRAIALAPNQPDPRGDRGVAYLRLGRLDQAIADFNAAIRMEPKRPHHRMNRGDARLKAHDFKEAIADYSDVIRMGRRDLKVYMLRGDAYLGAGERAKAAVDYAAALSLDPNNKQAAAALEKARSGQ